MRNLMTHTEFEARYPDELTHQQELERRRRAAHVLKHGSDETYAPLRDFPCHGVLRADEGDAPILEVYCSACLYSSSIRNPDRAPAGAPETETASSYWSEW